MITKIKPDNFTPTHFVSSVILVEGDKICLAQRSLKKEHGAGKWSIPGGKKEVDETPLCAAQREIQEEIGLNIKESEFIEVGTYYYQASYDETYKLVCTLYKVSVSNKSIRLNDENMKVGWFSLEEALTLDLIETADVLIKDAVSLTS